MKVYYSSVSDQELVRIFGDEAPVDTTVGKVLTVDPNKVATIDPLTGEVVTSATLRAKERITLPPGAGAFIISGQILR